ncbi:unnamed protein product [Caenorhabditis angaria]|uniref:Uncharacterized protein n=1 Tax=Caenorhabditis angaria TaxID=860376 RepID=A0A9P1N5Z6_9PELO|nr:unnamed protein product [Caenorhabditis angaria]
MAENENRKRIMKKILILGPTKAGKTTLATFLGEYMGDEIRDEENRINRKMELEFTDIYRPTKGVRIVEFESHEFLSKDDKEAHENEHGRIMDVEIQLWDVSGDRKYEDCWPAIKENVNGVILVANPEEHSGKDLLIWYQEFVEKERLDQKMVMVLLNEQGPKKTNHELVSAFEIQPQLHGVSHVACHFGSEGLSLKQEVNNFLVKIMMGGQSQSETVENVNIMEDIEEDEDDF